MQFKYLLPVHPRTIYRGLSMGRTVIQNHPTVREVARNSILIFIPLILPFILMLVWAAIQGEIRFEDFELDFDNWDVFTNLAVATVYVGWAYWVLSIVIRVGIDVRSVTERISADMVASGINPNATVTEKGDRR